MLLVSVMEMLALAHVLVNVQFRSHDAIDEHHHNI